MNVPPRILTIYYKHKPGGFCKRLRMMIEAYLEKGWTVHYVAVEPFPYTHPRLVPHILPTPMRRHDSPWFWLYFFSTAPMFVLFIGARHRVDLISVFSFIYTLICCPLKWLRNIPLIAFIRSVPNASSFTYQGSGLIARLETLAERIGLNCADAVLANSSAIRSALIQRHGRKAERIGILRNHIPKLPFDKKTQRDHLLKEFGLGEDRFVIATSGILVKRKKVDQLVRAFAAVQNSRAVLLVFGDGVERSSLETLAETLCVKDRVIFTGWREDIESLLQGADLFVLPSAQEGMSNSLLEAMACGLPCLVSDIPENIEIVQNPEQHFPLHEPQTLAQKLDRLLEDEGYLNQLLQASQKDRDRFVFDWSGELIKNAEVVLDRRR